MKVSQSYAKTQERHDISENYANRRYSWRREQVQPTKTRNSIKSSWDIWHIVYVLCAVVVITSFHCCIRANAQCKGKVYELKLLPMHTDIATLYDERARPYAIRTLSLRNIHTLIPFIRFHRLQPRNYNNVNVWLTHRRKEFLVYSNNERRR